VGEAEDTMADARQPHLRGEGGAPADRYAIHYYQQLWAQGGLMGEPARVNGHGFVMACPGRSSDVIHIYVWIEAGQIHEARWQCHMCDPWMQVAGDILCHLMSGSPPEAALQWTWDDFERRLGGPSVLIREHAGAAMLTLHKAVIDYQVRTCLAGPQNDAVSLEATQKLRELGLVGREGQQHLRRRLEETFAALALQIPHVKVQEWIAMGSVQDVSLTVQSLIERQIIQRILGQGCGFPRSFEEQLAIQS
jgi:hypothetical protein